MYSPHTAVDCASGGLGDWLADIVTGTPADPQSLDNENQSDQDYYSSKESSQAEGSSNDNELKRPTYMLQHHPSQLSLKKTALRLSSDQHDRYPIQRVNIEGHPDAGMGRIVRFAEPVPLTEIIDRIGLGLGNPKGFPIAIPQGKLISEMMIGSIALCAGAGGHLFGDMEKTDEEDVDLLFTGELNHHEALAAIEKGKCIICLFHSNTERGFLQSVLKGQLEREVKQEVSHAQERLWKNHETGYVLIHLCSGTRSGTRTRRRKVSAMVT